MKDCCVRFRDEVFRIEAAGSQLNTFDAGSDAASLQKRGSHPPRPHRPIQTWVNSLFAIQFRFR